MQNGHGIFTFILFLFILKCRYSGFSIVLKSKQSLWLDLNSLLINVDFVAIAQLIDTMWLLAKRIMSTMIRTHALKRTLPT